MSGCLVIKDLFVNAVKVEYKHTVRMLIIKPVILN